jgi:hypothetical protein
MPAMNTGRRDAALAAGIFVGALAWFAWQPRNLGPADESFFLVEAMRMAGGERLYQDLFWFGMPGGHWLLAGAFSVFGASIVVAKMTIGVVNALSGGADLRRQPRPRRPSALAVLPALAFLALAQPAWPYVSAHWMSTTLMLAVFLLAVSARALEQRARLVAIGLALGTLGAVYQQKAPVIAVGVGVAILLACWIRTRSHRTALVCAPRARHHRRAARDRSGGGADGRDGRHGVADQRSGPLSAGQLPAVAPGRSRGARSRRSRRTWLPMSGRICWRACRCSWPSAPAASPSAVGAGGRERGWCSGARRCCCAAPPRSPSATTTTSSTSRSSPRPSSSSPRCCWKRGLALVPERARPRRPARCWPR